MPVYEFHCEDGCNTTLKLTFDEYTAIRASIEGKICVTHEKPITRIYRPFRFKMPIMGGYSPTVGQNVTGSRDFAEKLKIASAQATERTGMEHNFKPVDMRDIETLGVSEEGLAADNKTRHDRGEAIVRAPGLDV